MAIKRRVVVVGLGSIGQRHARLLAERSDLAVELCEPNPATAAEARRNVGELPLHTSFSEMLQTHPEIVVIATPHTVHTETTCAALRAGAHVLCEKPMSDSIEGANQMAAAQKETGKVLRVGFTLRFNPALLRLKRLIDDGELGTPLHVRYAVGSRITLENTRSRYQHDLFAAAILDYVHGIDLLQWLLQVAPQGVYARGIYAPHLSVTSNPNVLAAIFDYGTPFLAELHIDYVAKPEQHFIEVLGETGWARLNIPTGQIEVGRSNESTSTLAETPFERDDLFRAQRESFLMAIDGYPATIATAEEGLATNAVIEAVIASLKSGLREPVQERESGTRRGNAAIPSIRK